MCAASSRWPCALEGGRLMVPQPLAGTAGPPRKLMDRCRMTEAALAPAERFHCCWFWRPPPPDLPYLEEQTEEQTQPEKQGFQKLPMKARSCP